MSKHHEKCCCENYGYGAGYGYGMGYDTGCGYGFFRWIYALLILIVIVLQFGRNCNRRGDLVDACEDIAICKDGSSENGQVIDNSVLFIIIVFLLIICAGCGNGFGCNGN